MSRSPVALLVSADHPDRAYALRDRLVEARPSPGSKNKYYVSLTPFGCGKDYPTPTMAVQELLLAHGCTRITVVPSPDPDDLLGQVVAAHDVFTTDHPDEYPRAVRERPNVVRVPGYYDPSSGMTYQGATFTLRDDNTLLVLLDDGEDAAHDTGEEAYAWYHEVTS